MEVRKKKQQKLYLENYKILMKEDNRLDGKKYCALRLGELILLKKSYY